MIISRYFSMVKKPEKKLNTMEMMTLLFLRAFEKPKEVCEVLDKVLASISSPETMEFFLLRFDIDHCKLPKNRKPTKEDQKSFAKMVEAIRVYRTIYKLSPEQKEVLDMLLTNPACSDQDIADKLGKKPKAVSAKIGKLLKKFGCYTRADLIAKVIDHPPFNAAMAAALMPAFFPHEG